MAKFRLEINCDNAAFEGGQLGPEILRIMGTACAGLPNLVQGNGPATKKLYDINGNVVGHAEYTEEG